MKCSEGKAAVFFVSMHFDTTQPEQDARTAATVLRKLTEANPLAGPSGEPAMVIAGIDTSNDAELAYCMPNCRIIFLELSPPQADTAGLPGKPLAVKSMKGLCN